MAKKKRKAKKLVGTGPSKKKAKVTAKQSKQLIKSNRKSAKPSVRKESASIGESKASNRMAKKKSVKKSPTSRPTGTTTNKKQGGATVSQPVSVNKAGKSRGAGKKGQRTSQAAKVAGSQQIPLAMENWPMDREIVFNPDRFKYLTRVKTDTCVFCAAAAYGPAFASLVLYRDSMVQVVVNKYPYYTGHIMVMPVRHVAELELLQEAEYQALMLRIRHGVAVLKKAYRCTGVNVGINLGSAAGAGIPDHLHWHLIPRWMGDTNFFPAIAHTRVISESLETTYNKLLPYFQQGGEAENLVGNPSGQQVEFALDD